MGDGMETPASVVSVSPSTSTSTSISSTTSMSTHNATHSKASISTEKAHTITKPIANGVKPRRAVVVDPNLAAQPMSGEYTQDRALEDLPGVAHALSLFLASHMVESEKFCLESDPKK